MNKPLEPYKALISFNGEILYSTSHIAYHLGRLSVTDNHAYDDRDALNNAKSIFEILGLEATPSQIKGLLFGEDIEGKPSMLKIYRLCQTIARIDPYDIDSLKRIEDAFFPYGVPNRMSRRIEEFPYPIPQNKQIAAKMQGLFRFAKSNASSMNPITIGCVFSFMFQAIAPYSSGNLPISLLYLHAFLVSYSKSLASLNVYRLYKMNKEAIDESYKESVEKGDMCAYLLCWGKLLDKALGTLLSRSIRGNSKDTPLVEK